MMPSTCDFGQHFQTFGQSFSQYGPPSWQITYVYLQSNPVFPSAYTNKIYRFVKIPLFAVAQEMLNNFIMLVYVSGHQ